MMGDFMDSLPYTCRGFYFKPLFLKFKDILHNFDDTLVKKVLRTKYKETSAFLLTTGDEGTHRFEHEEVKKQPAFNEAERVAGNAKSDPRGDGGANKQLYIMKTSQPDVYEVYENNTIGSLMGIACVNNLSTSRLMRSLFAQTTPTEKIRMDCVYSTTFNKWVPVKAAATAMT